VQQRARTKPPPSLVGVLALLVAVVVLLGVRLLAGSTGSTVGAGSKVTAGTSGLPTIRVGSLPTEAQHTVQLIAAGGPFPYPRDGIVFANREGILPSEASGYYREYTVVTPGSSDRGARRVIAGRGGEEYYTDDHYASFQEIVP
jgi:ribonuclease T1